MIEPPELKKKCRHFYNGRWQNFTNHLHQGSQGNNARGEWVNYLFATDPTCKLCLKPIEKRELADLDHVIPRSHGGVATTDNVQLAHKKCNREKGKITHRLSLDEVTDLAKSSLEELRTHTKSAPKPLKKGSE